MYIMSRISNHFLKDFFKAVKVFLQHIVALLYKHDVMAGKPHYNSNQIYQVSWSCNSFSKKEISKTD